MTRPELTVSKHFRLEKLTAGVYAAIALESGAGYSNAGIVDLGDQTLVFDAFDAPQPAEDLRAAAEALTGRRATYLINSHSHGDHWSGNQAFAGATIIATFRARARMQAAVPELEALKAKPAELLTAIHEYAQRLEGETDPHWRASLERTIARMRFAVEEALPILTPCLPNLAFGGRLVFHGAGRWAELVAVGHKHSPGDAYLLLPQERLAFLGDLGFFQCQPFLPDCDLSAWQRQLERLEEADLETLVPGHGPLGAKADLARQRQYVTALEEMVAGVLRSGGTVEEALEQPMPAAFADWASGAARYAANVRFVYQRQSRQRSGGRS
jgi:cyclase